MKLTRTFLVLTASLLMPAAGQCQDSGWPRVMDAGWARIAVYEPQPDSFDGSTLQSRAAVSITKSGGHGPVFGALWLVARLDVDQARDQGRVVSLRIEHSRFTGVAGRDVRSAVQFLEADVSRWNPPVSMTRLRAMLRKADSYNHAPPSIVVMDSPAILLLLDGPPVLQDAGPNGLQRVVNTALPVIFDSRIGRYWLYASSGWFTTSDLLHGSWIWVEHASSEITALVRDVETLDSMRTAAGGAVSAVQLRAARVVVATEPTELLVTDGAPNYRPLVGDRLFYVSNTGSDIFLESATQKHYILISGRWFAGPSMQGPWSFVPPEKLPRVFSLIPENSAKENVLAFVPGTDRARDALMDYVIPQTAEIPRGAAQIDVHYDGAPLFTPIANTSLAYAENTPAQVIRSGGLYYACDDGVWYLASSPLGPWSVSDRRPDGIENIPPAIPVYNTQFVYIYGSTPYAVHVGYLPGYRWSLPYHGVVLHGTGYRYRGWFGRYYYPRSVTRVGGWAGPGGYRPPRPARPPSWHPPGRPAEGGRPRGGRPEGGRPEITRPEGGGRPGGAARGNPGMQPRNR